MSMQTMCRARWLSYHLLLLLLITLPQAILAQDKINVFVSVLPQKVFVERIGGETVKVGVMVKPGFSPATYEPTPRQIAALSKAQLYIRIGVPFEQAWMPRIKSVNAAMQLLDAREGLELRELDDHHHDHNDHGDEHKDHQSNIETDAHNAEDHESEAPKEAHKSGAKALDPHLWTDPRLVIKMANQIRDALLAFQPQQRETFNANHAAFVAELRALDAELRTIFAASNVQKFMVFHPSWGYLADTYGLEQVAIESEGKEPGAKALTALIKQARLSGVKTIFVQPQFDKRAAQQVAKAIDGAVVAVDPLAEDYFATMRKTARLIAGVDTEQSIESSGEQ